MAPGIAIGLISFLGFAAGYGVRAMISHRRRRHARMSRVNHFGATGNPQGEWDPGLYGAGSKPLATPPTTRSVTERLGKLRGLKSGRRSLPSDAD